MKKISRFPKFNQEPMMIHLKKCFIIRLKKCSQSQGVEVISPQNFCQTNMKLRKILENLAKDQANLQIGLNTSKIATLRKKNNYLNEINYKPIKSNFLLFRKYQFAAH